MPTAPSPVLPPTIERIGGVDFCNLPGGPGTIGLPQGDPFYNFRNPLRDFTAPPILVGRDLIPNSEIDAYRAAMGGKTHALLIKEHDSAFHLVARGRPEMTFNGQPTENCCGLNLTEWMTPEPALIKSSITFAFYARVVPPAGRYLGISSPFKKEQDPTIDAIFAKPDHPAVMINLYEVVGYLAYKSAQTGRRWFLMNADTWEWMATLGQGPARRFGTDDGTLSQDKAKYFTLGVDDYKRLHTAPIGQYPATPWGIRDVSGNAREWVMSAALEFPNNGTYLMRGGSWRSATNALRVADVDPNNTPEFPFQETGFRAAVEPI